MRSSAAVPVYSADRRETPCMTIEELRFTPDLLRKPPVTAWSAETTLRHFAIVTYWVEPDSLRPHLHPRFAPDVVRTGDGRAQALVSVVTFLDHDFRFAAVPWFARSFGQTNYRCYVTDTATGEHVVWFFGTCLSSPV